MRAGVAGVGVWSPGLQGWEQARAVLRGTAPFRPDAAFPPPPPILSATERRRTGLAVRLALSAAQQATEMAGLAPDSLRSVFGSSNGDGAVIHAILETLSGDERSVSPTQFHNSVHNAAAGYWTIATGSATAATCLGCHDATFAASLLKAMAELASEGQPVLLCVYDAPLPDPLGQKRRTAASFAAAFVLQPGTADLPALEVGYDPDGPAPGSERPRDGALLGLWHANPAARSLRLLEALAQGRADQSSAALLEGRIDIRVTPCSTAPPSCA